MNISINGIAHLLMNVSPDGKALELWELLCHFLKNETLLQGEDSRYFIGGRTGILVCKLDHAPADQTFDQNQPGLHHLYFRARSRHEIDQAFEFISNELKAHIIRARKVEDHYAAGYYSILFEDPGDIRIEINHVPWQEYFGDAGRLGLEGAGPATHYGEDGLTDSLEP